MPFPTEDLRIKNVNDVVAPYGLHQELPVSEQAATTVYNARLRLQQAIHTDEERLVVVTGPCSIHDTEAAIEYAERLRSIKDELSGELFLLMRVYFEKPRTTVGWKGLINDPDLNGSFEINKGLRLARQLLLRLAEMQVPAGTEFLDVVTPQYIADLVSWGAIGARTVESQVHRQLASGLSMPVGFKNGTDGNLQVAIDAVRSATQPHHFLSLTQQANAAIFATTGNPDCHIILRGGKTPNYDAASISEAAGRLQEAGLSERLMVDCSHANSRKNPDRQFQVAHNIAEQIAQGEQRLFGVMLESHLVAGRQDLIPGQQACYGQSITDPCMGWEETEQVLYRLAEAVRVRKG